MTTDQQMNTPIPWLQYFSVLTGSISVFTAGVHYGWSSPFLPLLEKENSIYHFSSEQGAWIASMLLVGPLISCSVSTWLLNNFGRRTIVLWMSVPFVTCSLLLAFAESAVMFYIARIAAGFAMGTNFISLSPYIGEISDSRIRGALASLLPATYNTGILVVYIAGAYLSVRTFAFISISFPLLFFVTFWWAPESPYYLIMKGQILLAKESLRKLKRRHNIDEEFHQIQVAVERDMANSGGILDLIKNKTNRKAFLIMIGMRTFQGLCGSTSFVFYAEQMFGEEGGIFNSRTSAMIFAMFQVISTLISAMLLDKIGRRPLLIVSCIGSAVSLGIQGFCFFRKDFHLFPHLNLQWLPIVTVVAYVFLSTIGLGVVPYVFHSELLPTNVKNLATCLIILYFDVLLIAVAKLHQTATDYIGTYTPFWFYMVCCIIGLGFVLVFVPETKGKSLEEIQNDLKSTKSFDGNHN